MARVKAAAEVMTYRCAVCRDSQVNFITREGFAPVDIPCLCAPRRGKIESEGCARFAPERFVTLPLGDLLSSNGTDRAEPHKE